MQKIRLGYDSNLGLPPDFSEKIPCDLVGYEDITLLVKLFQAENLDSIFIPVGTLPYIKKYQIISQAIFDSDPSDTLRSNFVTSKAINISNIADHSLGRVNKYCTTSYWAPLIYLMDYLPQGTPLKFQDTNGFQDMLNKTAQEIIDSSTVWDIILQQNPTAAHKVHELFSVNALPSPVLISNLNISLELCKNINQFKTNDQQWFYRGFQAPKLTSITQFLTAIQKAITFYNLPMK